jgi:cell shape-determining protein MreC
MKFKFFKKTYAIIGVILVLLIFLNYFGCLNFVKFNLRNILEPIFGQANNISIKAGDNYEFFKDRESFFSAYRECRASLENMDIMEAKIKMLEDENILLKNTIDFTEGTKFTHVTARVVGKNIEKTDQTILIDIGLENGVQVNQPVIQGNGILIGSVIKSEKGLSIIRLLNDNQSKIAATILNNDKSLGVVEGGYGLSIKMNFIPRNEIVRIGDYIVT